MAGRVTAWLLCTDLRSGPGLRVALGALIRDRQPWRFPLECPSLGMAVHVAAEPGPHELGFALSYGEEVVAPPLIVDVDIPTGQGWVFLDRGPHELPGPGSYYVDISLDGELAEDAQIILEEMPRPTIDISKWRKRAKAKAAENICEQKEREGEHDGERDQESDAKPQELPSDGPGEEID